jgi:hypothetical protein
MPKRFSMIMRACPPSSPRFIPSLPTLLITASKYSGVTPKIKESVALGTPFPSAVRTLRNLRSEGCDLTSPTTLATYSPQSALGVRFNLTHSLSNLRAENGIALAFLHMRSCGEQFVGALTECEVQSVNSCIEEFDLKGAVFDWTLSNIVVQGRV